MGSLKKNCKTPGCPNLHTNRSGYCDECMARYAETHPKTAPAEDRRPNFRERGYTSKWTKFARAFVLNHPKCAICGAPSKVCDHKDMPYDVMLGVYGGEFDYDESHYQALCMACNNRKGRNEDVKARNRYLADLKKLGIKGGDK